MIAINYLARIFKVFFKEWIGRAGGGGGLRVGRGSGQMIADYDACVTKARQPDDFKVSFSTLSIEFLRFRHLFVFFCTVVSFRFVPRPSPVHWQFALSIVN